MRTFHLIPDPTSAARAAAALIGSTAVFQVTLAAGAPWGAAAWGGRHPGVLPTRLRRASAVSALALGSLAVAVGSPDLLDPTVRRRVLLSAVGYFALGTAMNAASPSPVERAIWTPVAGTTAGLLWRATPRDRPHPETHRTGSRHLLPGRP
jgi:predicted MFS family arabinose efflux permease